MLDFEQLKNYFDQIQAAITQAEETCIVKIELREEVGFNWRGLEPDCCAGCPFQDFFEDLGLDRDPTFFECRLVFLRRWCPKPQGVLE